MVSLVYNDHVYTEADYTCQSLRWLYSHAVSYKGNCHMQTGTNKGPWILFDRFNHLMLWEHPPVDGYAAYATHLSSSVWNTMAFRKCVLLCAHFVTKEDTNGKCAKCMGQVESLPPSSQETWPSLAYTDVLDVISCPVKQDWSWKKPFPTWIKNPTITIFNLVKQEK